MTLPSVCPHSLASKYLSCYRSILFSGEEPLEKALNYTVGDWWGDENIMVASVVVEVTFPEEPILWSDDIPRMEKPTYMAAKK